MKTVTDIMIKQVNHSRINEVDWDNMEFGNEVSDHMFVCNYDNGEWQEPAIIPFQDLRLSPTTLALHYGQSVFEGMKAFRMDNGSINIFRINKHHDRLNITMERMCMPPIPYELFHDAIVQLVAADKQWVPSAEGSALYIRPFVFASEARYGVHVSNEYKFIIFTGPVPPFYSKPLKVKVERKYIRAAKGGTGYAKCAGNYAGALYPSMLAKQEGFDQVLWTDAFLHEFIEESGTMNVMFVINGTLVTPALSDSILDGVTRDTLLQLAQDMNIPVAERPVSIQELREDSLQEAFGAGTAAVVAPIKSIGLDDVVYHLPLYNSDSVMMRLKKRLEDIRLGRAEDVFGWNEIL